MSLRLATIEEDGWCLDNGVALHRRHPATFEIPPADHRENLQPGQVVKLRFVIHTGGTASSPELAGERMWVAVTERRGEFYVGLLDDDSTCSDRLQAGTQVVFRPENVIGIWHTPEQAG